MTRLFACLVLLFFSGLVYAKTWVFDVYLDDRKIGQHTFDYQNNTLTSQADFKVKILMFTAYEYHHNAVERWAGNCLTTLKADTIENEVLMQVEGQTVNGEFLVNDKKNTQALPDCTMTFAYWNPMILQQSKLLNPQNAEYLDVYIQPMANKKIQKGEQLVELQGYQILGALDGMPKLNIKVWYDESNDWVALQSITPEGYLIDYRLQTP